MAEGCRTVLRSPADRACGRGDRAGHTSTEPRIGARVMKPLSYLLPLITTMAFVVIVGPILTVVIVSFTASDFFVFPPPALSLRWFREFFDLANMRNAFALSVGLAIVAAS